MTTNHLARESSPYLKQHMHNPVAWHPWGSEALEKAKREDRPIFLSIGYSACHWCHVMAHESFEDPETAAFLNENFVSIKVDREERPDLDALYMRSVMLLTGSGGWPLSVFLTPDLKPFFGGTYYPKESRWGMPSFRQVLEGVAAAYRSRRSEVDGSGAHVLRAVVESFSGPGPSDVRGLEAAEGARAAIMSRFDDAEGGFGGGPKFPQPALLRFLLDQAILREDREVQDKIIFTLKRMEAGGLRDQVGGGFHRYSVDGRWLVPHFEKMLYDNAQLASLYFHAYALTADPSLRRVGEEILQDMTASMASPGGGFVAAIDADSEGEEGKFYLWTPDEIVSVLGEEESGLIISLFGLSKGEALEDRILRRVKGWSEAAQAGGQGEGELIERVRADLDALRAAREKRGHPGVDIKVLTDWNALAAEAFVDGFMATGDDSMMATALRTLECIWGRGWDGEMLNHVWDGERAKVPGFLSDYAYLASAHWRAYEAGGDPIHLERVDRLLRLTHERFLDDSSGRLCDAVASEGGVLVSVRDTDDGVLPSPLAVYARTLWYWERLTDSEQAGSRLDELLRSEGGCLKASPGSQPVLAGLCGLRSLPAVEVVVSAPDLSRAEPLLKAARGWVFPGLLVLPLLSQKISEEGASTPSLFAGRRQEEGASAYLCVAGSCRLPVTEPAALDCSLGKAVTELRSRVRPANQR